MRRSIPGAATAALLSLTTLAPADVIYVNANLGSGLNDGSSWANAYQSALGLQNALGGAAAGDQIWIAAGTYLPADGAPRTASFILRTGVEIYGGFAGGETTLDERDWSANEVTLSGDLAQNDPSTGDNAYHVVQGGAANDTALLSGVTITAGFANLGSGNRDRGGGLYVVNNAAPRVEDCIVRNNRCTFGGGACYIANADPSFARVDFVSNIGGSFGGAFDIFSSGGGSVVDFDSCRFIDNFANRAGAVEVYGNGTIATLVNCLFLDNRASTTGGAVYCLFSGRAEIHNATVVNNDAGNTGGLHLTGLSGLVRNTIAWGNTDNDGNSSQVFGNGNTNVQFSNVEGGWSGAGNDNIDAAPIFEDISAGDANLAAGSPGIDAGSNALVPAGVDTDLDGGPRFTDDPDVADTGAGEAPIVDMGALERDIPCPGDADGSGHVTFADLLVVLGDWGPCMGCPGDLDGNGAADFLDLLLVLGGWGPCP